MIVLIQTHYTSLSWYLNVRARVKNWHNNLLWLRLSTETAARHRQRQHRGQETGERGERSSQRYLYKIDISQCWCWLSHFISQNHGTMGRMFPDGGLLRYRKWVPQRLGDVIVVTNSPPIGHMGSQLTNHQVGIVLDVQTWSEKLY